MTDERANRVRWGFIGAGDVTEVKSGPAFRRVPGSSVSVIMRRDAGKARDYAARHGVPRWTTDARAVVEADDVDAVYVATPPSSHAEYVMLAAAAGKPVYVEKPMARTAAEGEAMVAACRAAGVPLYVAYYRRALPRFERVRDLIQGGSLGTPTLARLTLTRVAPAGETRTAWRWDRDVAGAGLLLDLGSHALDLLDHWLGPISDAHGFLATRQPWARVPDQVVGALRFASGVLGAAAWDFAGSEQRDELTVTLTGGEIRVPVFDEGPVRVRRGDGTEAEHVIPHPTHVQEPLITRVVADLLGRGTGGDGCPSTGESALRTQRVMDALLGEGRLLGEDPLDPLVGEGAL
ncbi:MAG: Gfo/Idh/MocA family oxidoreductase [Trueperaceae bacterium]|nr:Gfo/Idh/MocA family oxidoreductase [Trueperaceae bacterium]